MLKCLNLSKKPVSVAYMLILVFTILMKPVKVVAWSYRCMFLKGSGYFAVDGNLPSETILP